jgi:hypothetical protein
MSASETSFLILLVVILLISIINLIRVLILSNKVDQVKTYELRLIAFLCYTELLMETVILLNIWFERVNISLLQIFIIFLSGSCFLIATNFAVIIAYVSHE